MPRKYGKKKNMKKKKKRTTAIPKSLRGYVRTSGYYSTASPGQELKYWDVSVVDAVVAATGAIFPSMNLIPQGTTQIQRDGRKCVVRAIGWKFALSVPAAATTGDTIRVILYVDKQCNGAAATAADLLDGAVGAQYQNFNNLANSGRFRTLMDRSYDVNPPAGIATAVVEPSISDSFYMKCNLPLEFSSTTGAITEIRSNNIGVLLISRAGVGGFESTMRVRFVG
ncbi:MAG: capsid protein [Circoviridae sp.]|nr:MAG: capsid protein [Circoviridae sp.]